MTYRYSLKKNPKLTLILIAAAVLPALALVLFIYIGPWAFALAAVIGIFFTYPVGKFGSSTLQSRIITHDDGVTATLTSGDTVRFNWSGISYCGIVRHPSIKDRAFLYDEAEDTYIEIPDEFTGFDSLIAELQEKAGLTEYLLKEGQSVRELIAELVDQNRNKE